MDPNAGRQLSHSTNEHSNVDPDERSAWLQQACAGDVVLLKRLNRC